VSPALSGLVKSLFKRRQSFSSLEIPESSFIITSHHS